MEPTSKLWSSDGTYGDAPLEKAIHITAHLTIRDVYIHDGAGGVRGIELASGRQQERFPRTSVTATNVTVSHNAGGAFNAGILDLTDVTADYNAGGVGGNRVHGTNVSTSNNTNGGILASQVGIDGLTANDNGGPGVRAKTVRLKNSLVTGNTHLGTTMDLMTTKRPRLQDSVCGRSQRINTVLGRTWRVCTTD